MGTPAVRSVVLVTFPFSDLSASKLRPAVVLADVGRGDYILCQVTSNPYADPDAVRLGDPGLRVGLTAPCQLRPSGQALHGKRIAHNGQCGRVVGSLATCDYRPRCFPVPSLTETTGGEKPPPSD